MALREFTDTHGHDWLVWDVYPTVSRPRDGRPSGEFSPVPWLAFHCRTTGERRRLMPIPYDWGSCSNAELEALAGQAEALADR